MNKFWLFSAAWVYTYAILTHCTKCRAISGKPWNVSQSETSSQCIHQHVISRNNDIERKDGCCLQQRNSPDAKTDSFFFKHKIFKHTSSKTRCTLRPIAVIICVYHSCFFVENSFCSGEFLFCLPELQGSVKIKAITSYWRFSVFCDDGGYFIWHGAVLS